MVKYPLPLYERAAALGYAGTAYALTIVVVSQFIYFSLHYIIGATLTIVACVALAAQIALAIAEMWHIERGKMPRLYRIFAAHFWINHLFQVVYIGFLFWAAVHMYERVTVV